MSVSLFKSEKICDLAELEQVNVVENDEAFVPLSESNVPYTLYDRGLPLSTGQDLYLRESVVSRLESAQKSLPKEVTLDLTYAYRSPAIQEAKFRHVLGAQIDDSACDLTYASEEQLRRQWIRATHMKIAAPEVAGHPSGGAVDVRLRDKFNRVIDMGTEMHDLTSPFTPYYPSHVYDFSPPFQKNRDMLREAMCEAGFAPFNGEWWHFSYGDREWAALQGQDHAIYAQRSYDHATGEGRPYNAMASHDILDDIIKAKQIKFAR